MNTARPSDPEVMPAARVAPRAKPLRLRVQGWLRWLHIYTSMLCLLIVLFFAATGVTLNHPDWLFGSAETRLEAKGTLPAAWRNGDTVDWLTVVEYLRATNGVRGSAGDYRSDNTEASLRFLAPGYSADVFINPATGAYTLNTSDQGWMTVLNDFHRGRNSGAAWAWLIDLSGGFLVLISLTGLGLLLYLKKLRFTALLAAVAGSVLMIALMHFAA